MEISTVFYPSKYLTAQGVHKAVQNNDNILQCQAENISINFKMVWKELNVHEWVIVQALG